MTGVEGQLALLQAQITLLQWAIGLVAAAGGGMFLFTWMHMAGGLKSLWKRLTEVADQHGESRLDDARTYATNSDLEQLGDRLEQSMAQTETRMLAAIASAGSSHRNRSS